MCWAHLQFVNLVNAFLRRTEERAAGWIRLTREILKLPEAPSVASKDSLSNEAVPPKSKSGSKARRPQPLIKLVMRRYVNFLDNCSPCFWVLLFVEVESIAHFLFKFFCWFIRLESSFRSFSRPVLHAAARVVQEMGKSRAAAYAVGFYDEGTQLQAYSENVESVDSDLNDSSQSEGIFS